jgi:hypothetical protein
MHWRVHVPSGLVVEVEAREGLAPRRRRHGSSLFSEVLELFESGDAALSGATIDDLELCDFHTLRAIVTHAGLIHEEPVTIHCRNCDEPIVHAPCGKLPLGPFVDGELDDPELDRTLEANAPHEIPSVAVAGGKQARNVTFAKVTVARAKPFFRALSNARFSLSADVVRAMGLVALGEERGAGRIARALMRASDEAWGAVGDVFLATHYPPRLFSIALCPKCGARNDVDAPYERELEPAEHSPGMSGMSGISPGGERARLGGDFPGFDAFADRARAAAKRAFAETGVSDIAFIVEGDVAACDDGGEPLLGAYVPGHPGDTTAPTRQHEITVYYRTFRAMWDEDGPYDWEGELDETIEHELEHHVAFLEGDDPMDEEERGEIRREAARVLGKKEVVRATVRGFRADFLGFLARTWPIWLILAVATIAVTLAER